MNKKSFRRRSIFLIIVSLLVPVLLTACGGGTNSYDTNLLKNPSFEKARNGLPENWRLSSFSGIKGEKEVEYGVKSSGAFDGDKYFYFKGSDRTKRWFILSQEVKVKDVTHVRLKGAMKLDNVGRSESGYSHCNFILVFFDKNHHRFQEMRLADKRTLVKEGTADWFVEDRIFRVPKSTAYISFGVIMGKIGTVMFDAVSLEVPQPLSWKKQSTRNFDFYSMKEKDFPEGSTANQQRMFDWYCKYLGVSSDVRISYYLYPDSASIKTILSLKGYQYISWADREIHTLNPNDEHEIIHFILDEYGKPPRVIAEGSAFYLISMLEKQPVHDRARVLLFANKLPPLNVALNYGQFIRLDPKAALAAGMSFTGYIMDVWGPERFLELLRVSSGANSYLTFSNAFEKAYKIPLDEVEQRWKRFLLKSRTEQPDSTRN